MPLLIVIAGLLPALPAAAYTYRYDAPGYHERYSGRCFSVVDRRYHYRVAGCIRQR